MKNHGLTEKEQGTALTAAAEIINIPYTFESQAPFRVWIDKDEKIYVDIKSAAVGFRAELNYGDIGVAILRNNVDVPTSADLLTLAEQLIDDDVQDFLLGFVMDAPMRDNGEYANSLREAYQTFITK
ncbi:hypothetical protein [Leuconostoc inhae]|uniref:hypothetical protein n=1 Tax=Leuconostoc inhae TaxID=178001 RepID=UPI001C7DA92D|nr:hypothetical protein [Leuconostoc inhae]